MPLSTEEITTGLIRRSITHISAPFGDEENAALHRMFKNASQTSTFEGLVTPWEDFCQNVLTQVKLPSWNKFVRIYANGDWSDDLPEDWGERLHEILGPGEGIGRAEYIVELRKRTDSPEWFAAEILNRLDLVRHAIAHESTATTAHLVWDLAILVATATFKFAWDLDVLRSKKMPEDGRRGGLERGPKRREAKEKEQANARKEADILWKTHPTWGPTKMAHELILKKKSTMKFNTIRGYLSKPEAWSSVKKKS